MSTRALTSVVQLRPAAATDADICGSICYEAFAAINRQHNFPPDFPSSEAGIGLLSMLFSHQSFYCVVAELDGHIVGLPADAPLSDVRKGLRDK